MAFVAFPDCIRVEVRFQTAIGKPIEITLWYRKNTGPVTQANVDIAADLIDTEVAADWLPLINAGIAYIETYVRDMTAEISYQATQNDGAGPGTRANAAAENHSALLVMRKSGLVGRSANGRVYIPGGVTTDRTNASQWTLTYANLWVAELEATDALFASAWTPIIASRKLRAAGNPVLTSTFPIATWDAFLNIAAVRARSD